MNLSTRLFEQLSAQTNADGEQLNSATIELVDVDVAIATVTFIEEIDESIQNPSNAEEAKEFRTALKNSRTEEVKITDSTLIEAIHREISDFETKWNVREEVSQDDITIQPTRIVYSNEWGVKTQFEIESGRTDWVTEFGAVVTEATPMIETVDALRSMNVRIMSGDWFKPFDYTIYFATETPHEYWANCETLHDYAEMVAEQRDDVTVEDVLNQDEYQSHTHLMNQADTVNEWFRDFIQETVDDHLENSDAVTVHPTQFNTEFDGFTLSGVITREL